MQRSSAPKKTNPLRNMGIKISKGRWEDLTVRDNYMIEIIDLITPNSSKSARLFLYIDRNICHRKLAS